MPGELMRSGQPLLPLLLLLLLPALARAQAVRVPAKAARPSSARRPTPARSVPSAKPLAATLAADTSRVRTTAADTTRRGGTVAGDTLKLPGRRRGDITTTIHYSATDSIRFNAPGKVATLYGDAHVDYGAIILDAARISIAYGTNTVTAEGAPDSTGALVGTPIFQNAGEQYEAKKIAYNFKTKKGKITEAITKQGEGYIHAEAVKRNAEDELYGLHGQYTTCDLEHPHFYIASQKMKVVPGQKIITGPFNLVVADIPTPLGFLFGFFPTPQKRASGIIIPAYGESALRGFYLSNGGFYWAASPSLGVKVVGDFYTLGGYRVATEATYIKRYRYQGNFTLSYLRNPAQTTIVGADLNAPIVRVPDAINVQWAHSPVQRPGGGAFTASVNAGSTGFYRGQVNTSVQNRLANTFNSNISYSKTIPNSPFNYTITANQSQVAATETRPASMTFQLPQFTLGMARQTPLAFLARRTGRRVFNNLTVGYSLDGGIGFSTTLAPSSVPGLNNEQIANARTAERPLTLQRDGLSAILRNNTPAVRHNLTIGLGTYQVAHINLSPGVTYNESWSFRRFSYTYLPDARQVRVDTTAGFYRLYQYSFNLGASTNIYAYAQLPKSWRVQVIRQQLTPTISFGYSPNYGDPSFGYYQRGVRTSPAGQLRDLPRYANTPAGGRSSTLSFSLSDVIEMKVKPGAGDTSKTLRKVTLINTINLSTGYNLLADSLNLAPISASLNARPFGLLNLGLSTSLNAYQRDTAGRVLNRYLVEGPGFKLARIENFSANLSFDFNPASRAAPGAKAARRAGTGPMPNSNPLAPAVVPLGNDGTLSYDYLPFELPWTVNAGFVLNYRTPNLPRGPRPNEQTLSYSISASGSVKLTKKFEIRYRGGYDLVNRKLVIPTFDFSRDLHCWVLTASWVPLGQYASYLINLSVNSGTLRDLKLTRNRSYQNR